MSRFPSTLRLPVLVRDRRADGGRPRGVWLSARTASLLAVVLGLCAAAVIAWFGRPWLFFIDEWGVILYRRAGGLDAFLAPHNDHLQAVTFGIYRLLFSSVGLESYTPYQAVGIAIQLFCAGALFLYALRRVQPELAVLALVPALFMAQAWLVLAWPYESIVVIPIAIFIAILLVRDMDWRLADPATAMLLLVALASSGLGVVVAGGIAVDILLRQKPPIQLAALRRLWVVVLPAAIYAAWFFLYRPHAETPEELTAVPGAFPEGDLGAYGDPVRNLGDMLDFLTRAVQAGGAGLLGLGPSVLGSVAFIVVGLGIALVVHRRGSLNVRLISLSTTLAAFWLLLAFTRTGISEPTDGRYIYPAVMLILLVVVEALAGLRLKRGAIAVAGLTIATVLILNLRELSERRDKLEPILEAARADLVALEDSRGDVPATFIPIPYMQYLTAGPYFEATDALGSPVE